MLIYRYNGPVLHQIPVPAEPGKWWVAAIPGIDARGLIRWFEKPRDGVWALREPGIYEYCLPSGRGFALLSRERGWEAIPEEQVRNLLKR
jgi:hypothetical protein